MQTFKDIKVGNVFMCCGSAYYKDTFDSCSFVSGYIENNMHKLIKNDTKVSDTHKTFIEFKKGK